jgi:hypothetical protein
MDELKRLIELVTGALADLEKLRAAVDAFRQIDPADIERLRKAAKTLPPRLDEGHAAIAAKLEEAAQISKRLADQGAPQPGPANAGAGVMATDLAKGFRSVIQTLQNEVGEGDLGDVGTIIKSMDVELKGLVVVTDQQPTIVPPTPDRPIDPGLLSTVRMSFASVPLQRTVNRDKPPG